MGSTDVMLYAIWAPTYAVTYSGNGATGGSAPTDPNGYLPGATVTVLGNSGNLVLTGYSFAGWNTQANGSGTSYSAGTTFGMGSANVTLYAQWTITNKTLTLTAGSGGAITIPSSSPVTVTYGVPTNIGATVNTNYYYFLGWTVTAGSGVIFGSTGTAASNSASDTVILTGSNATIQANFGPCLYVTDPSSNYVSAFGVNSNGTLSPIPGTFATGGNPWGIAISPNGADLYVANWASNSVSAFSVNSNGTLALIPGTYTTGPHPSGIAISPNGAYLFTANNSYGGGVSAFSIGSGGVLSLIGTYYFNNGVTPIPLGIAVSPNGAYLYVTNENSFGSNGILAFSINSDGSLSPIPGAFTTGEAPWGIAISPNGANLYVTNYSSNNVSAFSINSDGTLSPIPGTFTTGSYPMGIAISPNGAYLYVGNTHSSYLSAFSIGSDGALSSIGTPSGPDGGVMAFSLNGAYLYVSEVPSGAGVAAYSVDSGGILSSIGTLAPAGMPAGIALW